MTPQAGLVASQANLIQMMILLCYVATMDAWWKFVHGVELGPGLGSIFNQKQMILLSSTLALHQKHCSLSLHPILSPTLPPLLPILLRPLLYQSLRQSKVPSVFRLSQKRSLFSLHRAKRLTPLKVMLIASSAKWSHTTPQAGSVASQTTLIQMMILVCYVATTDA